MFDLPPTLWFLIRRWLWEAITPLYLLYIIWCRMHHEAETRPDAKSSHMTGESDQKWPKLVQYMPSLRRTRQQSLLATKRVQAELRRLCSNYYFKSQSWLTLVSKLIPIILVVLWASFGGAVVLFPNPRAECCHSGEHASVDQMLHCHVCGPRPTPAKADPAQQLHIHSLVLGCRMASEMDPAISSATLPSDLINCTGISLALHWHVPSLLHLASRS